VKTAEPAGHGWVRRNRQRPYPTPVVWLLAEKGRGAIGGGSRSTQQYYPGTIEALQTTLIF